MSLTPPKQKLIHPVIDMHEDLKCLADLFPIADVKNSNDALVLLLHAFMLDVGFVPKDVPENEKLKLLPENWRDSGVYRITYYHVTCPELCCLMTCVPLNQLLSVFGTVDEVSEFQQTTLCFRVNHYVLCCTSGFLDPSKFYCNVRELSRDFKDGFAYSLLAAMQDALGFGPTFGLSVVMDNIKVQILSHLPVGSLIAMSCVNKEFNELCDTSSLWKNLFLNDFDVGLVDSEEVKQDGWKKLYKKKYLEEKRRIEMLRRRVTGFPAGIFPGFGLHPTNIWYPPLPPNPAPMIGPGMQTEIPEEVRAAFPQLQRRRVPNNAMIEEPFLPPNPSSNIPGIFRFY